MERLTAEELEKIEKIIEMERGFHTGPSHPCLPVSIRLLAEVRRLSAVVDRLERCGGDLAHAMKRSVDAGCTDHLDCCDDGGQFWYDAIKMWEEAAAESAARREGGR